VKLLGWIIGVVAFGGLILLSIAGVTAAVAIIITAAAIVSMIALGSILGGRNTPNRTPYSAAQGDAPVETAGEVGSETESGGHPSGGDNPRDLGEDAERSGPE
jgi:hypothetical protein